MKCDQRIAGCKYYFRRGIDMAKLNLENYGITGVQDVVHNPSFEFLYVNLRKKTKPT